MSPIIEDPEGFFANLASPPDDLLMALEHEAAAEGSPGVVLSVAQRTS